MPDDRPALPNWLRIGANFVTLEITARPGSQRRGLLRVESRGLVIGVASPAEYGKANEELIATIAEIAGIRRTDITIVRGAGMRNKVIRIAGQHPREIAARLARLSVEAK